MELDAIGVGLRTEKPKRQRTQDGPIKEVKDNEPDF
jgi:hypothetical protein